MARWRTLAKLNDELIELVASVSPSAVTIGATNAERTAAGTGSGWVYDHSCHVVTNHHVAGEAGMSLRVKPPGRPELGATLVGTDPETDLAVIHVPGLTAAPLPLRAAAPRLGELCLAIGSPKGLRESASLGVVSGLSRQLPGVGGVLIEEVIQTDASVNPGNSGGPLVDMSGQVLGVNTAVLTDAQSISFAVPTEVVSDVVPELIRFGAVQRASLGVSIATSWTNLDGVDRELVTVQRVIRPGSPFVAGDVILQIQERVVLRRYDVRKSLGRGAVGRKLWVLVLRDGEHVELSAQADSR
jgi:serine protease Do